MLHTKNTHKLSDKSITDFQKRDDNGNFSPLDTSHCGKTAVKLSVDRQPSLVGTSDISCNDSEVGKYAVTVSKKTSASDEEDSCCGQKSFISIHSTDQLCQLEGSAPEGLDECNVEVLSLKEVFPSTSEESVSNEDESPLQKKQLNKKNMPKTNVEPGKSAYVPTNSKSTTNSGRQKEADQPSVHSDFDIPKSTLYVIGSNPGEPKMSYPDTPKKISKTMKKFLRNIDKHKSETSAKSGEKSMNKLSVMRGILKDGRCAPECTGDNSAQPPDDYNPQTCMFQNDDLTLPYTMDFSHKYSKHAQDKNVTFNKQVVIIHFNGDLCVGQSVEALSKEKDQQARNSELRKTFLTKYNEFWPTQK